MILDDSEFSNGTPLYFATGLGDSQGTFNFKDVGDGSLQVRVERESGGFYQSVNYNETSFNRGYILVTHTV